MEKGLLFEETKEDLFGLLSRADGVARVVLLLLSLPLSVHLSRVGRLCPAMLGLHGVLDGICALVGSNVRGWRGCGEELPPVVASTTALLEVVLLEVELLLLLELIWRRGSRIRFDGAPPVCIRVKRMARTVVIIVLLLLLLLVDIA